MPDILPPERLAEDFDFSKETDEALVFLAKKGNIFATEEIVNRYRNFAKICSQSYFLVGADQEDVVQEGMIGLYKAIVGFDAEKEVSFKTFAKLCIRRQIISAVKMSTRQKHIPLNTYVSLSVEDDAGCVECIQDISCDPEQIVIEKESVSDARERIEACLSSFEAEVLMHHLNGVPYTQIASYLKKDPKSVDNALQRIKHKVEKLLYI